MKRATFLISVVILSITCTLTSSGQKSDLAGKWKIDRQKSVLPDDLPALTGITINVKGDSLLTERVYETGDGQLYPFKENISLDGKECKMIIYEMPRKTRATWSDPDNSVNLESTITYYGSSGQEDFVFKEIWKADKKNNTLTISFVNKTSMGESAGNYSFTREMK
jgi:hypothetical protein